MCHGRRRLATACTGDAANRNRRYNMSHTTIPV
jgi:hypothetical protein